MYLGLVMIAAVARVIIARIVKLLIIIFMIGSREEKFKFIILSPVSNNWS